MNFLNTQQAANYLGLSAHTVCVKCRNGSLQFARRGNGPYRFKREWLDAYLNRRPVLAVPKPARKIRELPVLLSILNEVAQ